MEEAVLFSVENHVATITLNRPKSLNSMNDKLIDGLHEALDMAEQDEEIRCVVLTGSGKAFCAGGDLPFLEALPDAGARRAFIIKVGAIAKRITNIDKPFIAMVNGVAAGAGVNLMLACDLVYAADTARFAQSFAKVGLIPDCGGLYFLPKAVGVHRAKELMFTADLIDAAAAERFGMLNHVCTAEELPKEVYKMAARLAESAPLSLALIKKYVNNTAMSLDDVLDTEAVAQTLCMATEDCREGIAAFKEKRAPRFTGK